MEKVSKPTKTWRALDIFTHYQLAKALTKYFETMHEPNPSDAFLRELRLLVDEATVERAKAKVGPEGVDLENTAINLGMVVFAGVKAYVDAQEAAKLMGRPPDDGPRILH